MCAGVAQPSGAVSDDDVWGEHDDTEAAEQEELSREWLSRRQQYWNSGYREGMDEGKGETVQEGFNTGYTEGMAAGIAWGTAHGATKTLKALLARAPSLGPHTQQVEATAAEMEQPPKSVMLVTTAHILASHTAQEAAQRDSDGDDSRSEGLPGSSGAESQHRGSGNIAEPPVGTKSAAELWQAQSNAEQLMKDLCIQPVVVGEHHSIDIPSPQAEGTVTASTP